jgi:hypothetical protein
MIEGNWYNRVYLCWEDTNFDKPTTHNPVKGFKCYKYASFEGADNVWQNTMTEYKNMKIRHTIIPVCKLYHRGFGVGLSYDANLSKLKAASQTIGGLEMTMGYSALLRKFSMRGERGSNVDCTSFLAF